MFPHSIRVQYQIYLTSDKANASFILQSPKLEANLTEEQIGQYFEGLLPETLETLNEHSDTDDYREMTPKEVVQFIHGMHKHNLVAPEMHNENTHFRH